MYINLQWFSLWCLGLFAQNSKFEQEFSIPKQTTKIGTKVPYPIKEKLNQSKPIRQNTKTPWPNKEKPNQSKPISQNTKTPWPIKKKTKSKQTHNLKHKDLHFKEGRGYGVGSGWWLEKEELVDRWVGSGKGGSG